MKQKPEVPDKPLKALIESQGFNQKELAARTGISYAAVKFYVAGQKTPGLEIAAKMCRTLGVSFKELCRALDIDISGIPDDIPRY
jgi:transcriptional regulator with XRE-family HTH domain